MIYKLQTCWEVNKTITISVQFLSKSFHFFQAAMSVVNVILGEKQFASNGQTRLNVSTELSSFMTECNDTYINPN